MNVDSDYLPSCPMSMYEPMGLCIYAVQQADTTLLVRLVRSLTGGTSTSKHSFAAAVNVSLGFSRTGSTDSGF